MDNQEIGALVRPFIDPAKAILSVLIVVVFAVAILCGYIVSLKGEIRELRGKLSPPK